MILSPEYLKFLARITTATGFGLSISFVEVIKGQPAVIIRLAAEPHEGESSLLIQT
jgi:hypothetical protein